MIRKVTGRSDETPPSETPKGKGAHRGRSYDLRKSKQIQNLHPEKTISKTYAMKKKQHDIKMLKKTPSFAQSTDAFAQKVMKRIAK